MLLKKMLRFKNNNKYTYINLNKVSSIVVDNIDSNNYSITFYINDTEYYVFNSLPENYKTLEVLLDKLNKF
jgi:hypothetical protein